jgi:hypothetical protein
MKIRVIKTLVDQRYAVHVEANDFSESEVKRMVNYGEPEIDLGGTIGTETYPSDLEKLKSGSPFKRTVDGRDFLTLADAETQADAWATEIVARIKVAVDYVRALDDTFTEEAVETY